MGGLGYVRITQPEFNNTVLPVAAGVPYFVTPFDDGVIVPAGFAAGVHVVALVGASHIAPPGAPLYDGQHLYVCDPLGQCSAANILRIVGAAGGNGSPIAAGASPTVAFLDLVIPGVTALFVFSSATNTWNLMYSTAGGAGGDPGDLLLAGDLLGTGSTAAVPRVGSLAGVAGVLALATTAGILQWAPNVATPTIQQATTAAALGSVTLIRGQDSSHVAGVGGILNLSSGAGFDAEHAGALNLQAGGTTVASFVNTTILNIDPLSPAVVRYAARVLPLPIGAANETAGLYMKIDPAGADHQISGFYAEITTAQLDTYGPAIKIIHRGAGDAVYVAQFQPGGAGFECASFGDSTKGFISTNQVAAQANKTLFNALWQQDVVPNFGMFFASDSPGNALTIKKWTTAVDGQTQIRLIDRDIANRQRFGVYNDGAVSINSLVSTGGVQTRQSPIIRISASRWDGAASVDTGGYVQYAYDVPGNPAGGSGLRFYLGDLGAEAIAFIARATGFDLNGNSVTNCASLSGTLLNLQTSGNQFDHYVAGNVAVEYLDALNDGETAISVRRRSGAALALRKITHQPAATIAASGLRVLCIAD